MEKFSNYLERMIDGCDNLGGMEREKATYQSVLKEYRKYLSSEEETKKLENKFLKKELAKYKNIEVKFKD